MTMAGNRKRIVVLEVLAAGAIIALAVAVSLTACKPESTSRPPPPASDSPPVHFDDTLSPAVKQAIDNWIKANGLNEYGDRRGSIYPGGTPLFDEMTGKRLTRYQYIIENHPEFGAMASPTNTPGPTNSTGISAPTNAPAGTNSADVGAPTNRPAATSSASTNAHPLPAFPAPK